MNQYIPAAGRKVGKTAMLDLLNNTKYFILTGNYGSGKTELALNMALCFSEQYQTTLVDLDIVNPYFRSGEKADEMRSAGVRMLMPTYAMTTVDIPALPAEIQSVFTMPSEKVIFDVGGDDTGAAALGRFFPSFSAKRNETKMIFVINCMRPLTKDPVDIMDLAQRIQNRGRLKIDVLINNTNLADRTTPEMIEAGERIVLSCAEKMKIPHVITAGQADVIEQCRLNTETLFITRHMVPEWMKEQ